MNAFNILQVSKGVLAAGLLALNKRKVAAVTTALVGYTSYRYARKLYTYKRSKAAYKFVDNDEDFTDDYHNMCTVEKTEEEARCAAALRGEIYHPLVEDMGEGANNSKAHHRNRHPLSPIRRMLVARAKVRFGTPKLNKSNNLAVRRYMNQILDETSIRTKDRQLAIDRAAPAVFVPTKAELDLASAFDGSFVQDRISAYENTRLGSMRD